MRNDQLDQLCINTIRTLAMDAVQQANSGHPGTPLELAIFSTSRLSVGICISVCAGTLGTP
jgi:transketolase